MASSVSQNGLRDCCIAFILAFALFPSLRAAGDPPPDLARLVAERESATQAERSNYTYRQSVTVEEFDSRGGIAGSYREVREVIFTPDGQRIERAVGKPSNGLKRLVMTEEDFRDLRDVQPALFTKETLWGYDVRFRGDEMVDGLDCWVLQVRPRQILEGQRFFEGELRVDKTDYSIVRMDGRAVPQIYSKRGQENLFVAFTTSRSKVNGFSFPVHTYADDMLPFRTGPLRVRMVVRYSEYKKFGAESKILPAR